MTAPDRAGLLRGASGRLNDYLSTLPSGSGRTQALIDLNVILRALAEINADWQRAYDDLNAAWLKDYEALLRSTGDSEGPLDVERLARAFAATFPRGAADPHETARLVAAEYARLREDVP